jgi:hypothetical protein
MLVLADGSCCSARDDEPRKTEVVASVEPRNQSRLASAGHRGGRGGGRGGGGGGGEGKIRMYENRVGHLAGDLCECSSGYQTVRSIVLRYVVCGEHVRQGIGNVQAKPNRTTVSSIFLVHVSKQTPCEATCRPAQKSRRSHASLPIGTQPTPIAREASSLPTARSTDPRLHESRESDSMDEDGMVLQDN